MKLKRTKMLPIFLGHSVYCDAYIYFKWSKRASQILVEQTFPTTGCCQSTVKYTYDYHRLDRSNSS